MARSTRIREVVATYRRPAWALTAIASPETVAEFIRGLIGDDGREHFIVLHLDAAHQVIGYTVTSIGTANSCPIHPREVFQAAILAGSVAIILAHNHPSGSLSSSKEDRDVTDRLAEAGKLLGIRVLDHVIVTHDGHLSLLNA